MVSEFISFMPNYPVSLTWQKAVELNMEMNVFEDREFNDMLCSLIRLTELIMEGDMMHADLKSDNLLITIIEEKPFPVLIDYGNSLEQIVSTERKREHNKNFLDPFIFLSDAPPKTADLYSVMILIDKSTRKMKRMLELGDIARDFMKEPLEGRCDHEEMISRITALRDGDTSTPLVNSDAVSARPMNHGAVSSHLVNHSAVSFFYTVAMVSICETENWMK